MGTQKTLGDKFNSQVFEPTIDGWLDRGLAIAAAYSLTENSISVLSDLETKKSHIFWGGFAERIDMGQAGTSKTIPTIWEDEIFCHIHPEDLERKHLEELQFLHFIQKIPWQNRNEWCLHNLLRMRCADGSYIPVCHRIRYIGCQQGGSIRYALCLYNAIQDIDTESIILNTLTGEHIPLKDIDSTGLLSFREKEVLALISQGLRSKEIAEKLSISVFTVSRHRQNILEKLHAANSFEACRTARRLHFFQ